MNYLETQVLRLIGENVSNPDVFANTTSGLTQIRDSLTDAIEELAMLTGYYRRPLQLTLVTTRSFYRLAAAHDYVVYIHSAFDSSRGYRLEKTDLYSARHTYGDWMTMSGPPTAFAHVGLDAVAIIPKPSSGGQVVELDCVCAPKPYADSTSPVKIRGNYEQAAIYRAVGDFFASRGDVERATGFEKRYLETAGLMGLNPEYAERIYRQTTEKPWLRGRNV